jgi:hypothetical protein
MDKQETSHYAIQAVLCAATREDFESKIGRLEYSIGKYERLIHCINVILSFTVFLGLLNLFFESGMEGLS